MEAPFEEKTTNMAYLPYSVTAYTEVNEVVQVGHCAYSSSHPFVFCRHFYYGGLSLWPLQRHQTLIVVIDIYCVKPFLNNFILRVFFEPAQLHK